MDIKVLKEAGATWLRASVAAVAALYMSGISVIRTRQEVI
jgi:hypothetical protein